MEKNNFVVHATNDKIWNLLELIKYLSVNQKKCISLTINPEAICLRTIKLYDILDCFSFDQVDIHTYNQLELHAKYNIIIHDSNRFVNHCPDIDKSLHNWTLLKKFLSFYHRPTAARLGVASYLNTHYKEQSLIHFNYKTNFDFLLNYEFDKLALFDIDSLCNASNMTKQMPLLAYDNPDVDDVMSWYDYNRDSGINMYKNILVDIVVEAHVVGNTFFPTEKIVRPMLLKKPFIVHASKDFLGYLRQMGFRTFADFWDEDYDGFENRDRYIKILKVIDHIAGMSYQQLETMYWDMQYTLDHNYFVLTDKKFQYKITQI